MYVGRWGRQIKITDLAFYIQRHKYSEIEQIIQKINTVLKHLFYNKVITYENVGPVFRFFAHGALFVSHLKLKPELVNRYAVFARVVLCYAWHNKNHVSIYNHYYWYWSKSWSILASWFSSSFIWQNHLTSAQEKAKKNYIKFILVSLWLFFIHLNNCAYFCCLVSEKIFWIEMNWKSNWTDLVIRE